MFTFVRKVRVCVSAATFGLGSLRLALEVYRGYKISRCVERLSLLNIEGGRDFSC